MLTIKAFFHVVQRIHRATRYHGAKTEPTNFVAEVGGWVPRCSEPCEVVGSHGLDGNHTSHLHGHGTASTLEVGTPCNDQEQYLAQRKRPFNNAARSVIRGPLGLGILSHEYGWDKGMFPDIYMRLRVGMAPSVTYVDIKHWITAPLVNHPACYTHTHHTYCCTAQRRMQCQAQRAQPRSEFGQFGDGARFETS